MKPTNEQQNIIDAAVAGKNLAIQAAAGAGKSSTLRMVAEALPKKNILYLVFNKDNADEAAKTFPANVECRTINSLAYRAIVKFPKSAMGQRLKGLLFEDIPAYQFTNEITKNIYKSLVRKVITAFCHSEETDIRKFSEDTFNHKIFENALETAATEELIEAFFNHIQEYWIELCSKNSKVSISHDVYLKLYQLSEPMLVEYDLIMVDEFQDTNKVSLDILLRQPSQLIFVGDSNQSIYGFRGAIDGFGSLDSKFTKMYLTESFRFTQDIANLAKKALTLKGERFPIKGLATDRKEKVITKAVVCRSNVKIIEYLVDAIGKKIKTYTNVDLKEIAKLLYHVESAYYNKQPKFPAKELSHVTDNNSLYRIAKVDSDVKLLLNIILFLKERGGVYKFLNDCKSVLVDKEEADYSVITCHRAKGLEFSEVTLADDFGPRWDERNECYQVSEWFSKLEEDEQEVNLLYIGITRAMFKVDLPPALAGVMHGL